jgi:hypothetical protein
VVFLNANQSTFFDVTKMLPVTPVLRFVVSPATALPRFKPGVFVLNR